MTQRDRAWRRYVTRTIENRAEHAVSMSDKHPKSFLIDKPHQHDKLTHTQDLKMVGRLNDDQRMGWVAEERMNPPSQEQHALE